MKIRISRSQLSLLYVIAIIALLLFVGTSNYLASKNMEKEADQFVHFVIPITNTTNGLLTDLINQESGIRGYVLTGDQQYLQPYSEGKEKLKTHLETFRQYEELFPTLKLLIETQAVPAINSLQNHYESQIAYVQSGRSEEAKARISTGKAMMDRYRVIHDSIQAEIDKMSATSNTASKKAGTNSRSISIVSGMIALLIGGLSGIIFVRANRAETELRKSEETYRYMAESLETQNEEIIAQQEEQQITLAKLSEREQELELIANYQEKLTGFLELTDFLKHSIPALLNSLSHDAAMVVVERSDCSPAEYEVIYTSGYPVAYIHRVETELYGPAKRVFEEAVPQMRTRDVSEKERGLHEGITRALDHYYPLINDKHQVIGFLLLTSYENSFCPEKNKRLMNGLIRQFGLAFHAQVINEERRKQASHLEVLNDELIMEKQMIMDQRDLIKNILEATHEGMMLCDSQGTILFANQRMERYLKLYQQSNVNLFDVSSEIAATGSLSAMFSSVKALLDGNINHLSHRFSFIEDEQQHHAELYATLVGEDAAEDEADQNRYLFVIRDRTEEEHVDEMKNEFISIVSHELRTPLASVLGFVEILLHRELPPDKQKRYMDTIYNEALRLSNLINDFLDLQRMESGHQIYHFSPVDVVAVVQNIAEQWQGKQHHTVKVSAQEAEIWVRADIDRIRQVLHNLISNAIKYSPGADDVDIYVASVDGKVTISIQDYGLGIPSDAHDKLFSKFYRVDNSDRRQIGGTGLGLAIVKEIIEGHQGNITFSSEMGAGSTFILELDEYKLSPMDSQIVIFEDDDNLASLIQVALNRLNLSSVQLRSAEEGILALQRNTLGSGPLLFIVDIHLEGSKTGWDFLAELYRHPVHHSTPVIVSTALEPPHDYYEKEIEKYLKKPFTMERLIQVAKQLLDTKRGHAYVFPAQDKNSITATLQRNGIEVADMKEHKDILEVEIKKNS